MDGFNRNGISLFLGEIPGRKGLAFYFDEDGIIYPVAYVSENRTADAVKYWNQMMANLSEEGGV